MAIRAPQAEALKPAPSRGEPLCRGATREGESHQSAFNGLPPRIALYRAILVLAFLNGSFIVFQGTTPDRQPGHTIEKPPLTSITCP